MVRLSVCHCPLGHLPSDQTQKTACRQIVRLCAGRTISISMGHWPMSHRRCEIGGKFLSDPKDNLSLPIPSPRCRGGMLPVIAPTHRHTSEETSSRQSSHNRRVNLLQKRFYSYPFPIYHSSERNNLSVCSASLKVANLKLKSFEKI